MAAIPYGYSLFISAKACSHMTYSTCSWTRKTFAGADDNDNEWTGTGFGRRQRNADSILWYLLGVKRMRPQRWVCDQSILVDNQRSE